METVLNIYALKFKKLRFTLAEEDILEVIPLKNIKLELETTLWKTHV